jgi:hypothetical protein
MQLDRHQCTFPAMTFGFQTSKVWIGITQSVQRHGRSWCRIRVEARFSTLDRQTTGLIHLLYNGYYFPEINWSEHGVDHLPLYTSEAKNEWCCNFTPPTSLHDMDRENSTFTFTLA